jgi:fructose-specific phosphotransferase system IIC component
MLRFITHNLTGIDGVAIYPILSLLIFVLFFVLVIVRVTRMSKAQIIELSDLPLSDATSLKDELIQ